MKTRKLTIVSALSLLIFLPALFQSCTTVPITGRRQLSLVPESELIAMSLVQYNQFLEENKLSTDRQATAMVKRVGENISGAVERYFTDRGLSDQLTQFQWQFNLVENDTPNAWVMPGGKVVFYTGILPLTQNEDGIAVVMGHEIGHAVARHGSERMSHQLGVQFGAVALSALLSERPQETQNIFMAAFGATSQLGFILPYSRTHEYEADRLGMIFMAMAGYNPAAALDFWGRMAEKTRGGSTLAFLSTHPSDEARLRNMREVLPEAMKFYNPR